MTEPGTDLASCPSCGANNIAGADFCENCHTDLRRIGLPESTQPGGGTDFSSRLTEIRLNQPHVLPPTETVERAVGLLRADPNSAVVVRAASSVVGIFTERDVLARVAGQPELLSRPLSELMTRDPVVLRDTDTIAVALNKMVVGGFRHIPLIHGEALVGVVTATDLMQWFMQKYFD